MWSKEEKRDNERCGRERDDTMKSQVEKRTMRDFKDDYI